MEDLKPSICWTKPELDESASSYWDAVYPLLRKNPAVRDEDFYPFLRMCQLHSLAAEAELGMRINGLRMVTVGDKGQKREVKPPEFECYVRFIAELFKLEQRFGMSPKAREAGSGGSKLTDKRSKCMGRIT